jgi:hypothetical protein
MNRKANIVATVVSAIVGFSLVGTLTACNVRPKEFTSQAGSFSVMTPAPLTENIQNADLPQVGTIAIHMFTGTQGSKAYFVSYADFPEEFVGRADTERLLDGSRQGQVSNINGRLVMESKISLSGNPGRDLVIDAKASNGQDATIKSRIYLVRNRLYQVMVVAPKGQVSNDEMMKYLESFKLI